MRKNRKLGGSLLVAAGGICFVAAVMLRQPAFSGIGAALLIIGLALIRKARTGC